MCIIDNMPPLRFFVCVFVPSDPYQGITTKFSCFWIDLFISGMIHAFLDKGRHDERNDRMIRLLCCFLVLSFSIIADTANAEIPAVEREALIIFYNSTGGDDWSDNSGWKDGTLESDGFAAIGTECNWHGITCEEGHVVGIVLMNNQLAGVPEGLENLSNLKDLYLSENSLTGIPAALGNLGALELLYLDNNQLSNIPSALGNLTSLISLSLYQNQITTIPAGLENLANLIYLYLDNNMLTEIPKEFGNLTGLLVLYLNDNRLAQLPVEMTNMENLDYLDICGNRIRIRDDALRSFVDGVQPEWESCQKRSLPFIPLLLLDEDQ